MPGRDEAFDYVIAGGGTAGCVLARRLLERTDARIALIDAGAALPNRWLRTPLTSMRLGRWWHSWPLSTVPQAALDGRRIALPMGRLLGGSASINAMIAQPVLDADFGAWTAAGAAGWSAADRATAYARAFGAGSAEGLLSLTSPAHRSAFSEAFLAACDEGGLPRDGLLDGPDRVRCGYFPVLQKGGRRFSAFQAYLQPMLGHPRLTVIAGARIRHLQVRAGRVEGVVYARGGTLSVALARREVVLSLGAFESPRVLMSSGLGPADMLHRAGVPVIEDMPGVGDNLADHVRIPLLFRSGQGSPAALRNLPAALVRLIAGRPSVLTSNCCEAGAYLASSDGVARPDLQIITHFQSIADEGAVDIELTLARPRSRGRVSLDVAGGPGAALIDPRYLSDPDDLERLVDGIAAVRAIAAQPALARFPLRGECRPGAEAQDRAALRRYVRATATTAYHPVGTCRMGEDSDAVVDSRLRVHGISNLRVVDASVMPALPAANTCCAVILIAERAADFIA